MILGMEKKNLQTLTVMEMARTQIDLEFIVRCRDTWPNGKKLIQSGKFEIEFAKVATHSYSVKNAFEGI